jgi:hypothetical protein
MQMEEAAKHLVNEYQTLRKARVSDFSRIVTTLCHVYPDIPPNLIMNEVVRNFSRVETKGREETGSSILS